MAMEAFVNRMERLLALGGTRRDILFLVLSGAALLVSLFGVSPLPFDMAWFAIVLCSVPIVAGAVLGLVTEGDIKADVLVSLALIASVCIGEHFAAGEIAFIMQLGALLEEMTVARARAGIEKLVHLTPQTARVIAGDEERICPAEQVKVGERIRVLPGETVPVDGVILTGSTSVNQAVMTGESLPVDKTVGDTVSSGTVNQFGAFEMRATRVGEDSSIQRMIRLVQSADAGKAKIVGLADRWATWIVVIALAAAALTWLLSGQMIRAVTILVVFCPCALVLATPTAIMAAIGNATRHGFLVREGDALERLAAVSCVAFDKTGTLTCGVARVTAVRSVSGYDADAVFAYAAAAEQFSEHPLGKAIVRGYLQATGHRPPAAEAFRMVPGEGVCAAVGGKQVRAGNRKMLGGDEAALPPALSEDVQAYENDGSAVIFVTVDGTPAGYIVLSDTIREESREMIDRLVRLGVQPVLLTGDNLNAANAIGGRLHIETIHAHCLPEDKLRHIERYQREGKRVCMMGDGINDAPALKRADVGIAMGGVGSDIAVEAADIALVDDEVKELPHLVALSRRMMKTIRLNLTFSMALNFLAIALAITGVLNPVVGALVHNAGSVAVIVNSAFLLKWGKRQKTAGETGGA